VGHVENDKRLARAARARGGAFHFYSTAYRKEKSNAAMNATTLPLKNYFGAALAFLYPEVCQVCGEERATAAEGFVCPQCWRQVRFIRPPFCERCGLPFEGEITTKFECSNCREMELHFRSARSAGAG
jgi:predicted RNA-binding Zn-ribbon protein involved in translation (DUF1610 family)